MSDGSQILVKSRAGFHIIHAGKRLGVKETEQLREVLETIISEQRPMVIIDLCNVEFLGSRAIGVIMAAHGAIKSRKGRLILGDINPSVAPVLQITRVDSVIEMINGIETFIKRSEDALNNKEE